MSDHLSRRRFMAGAGTAALAAGIPRLPAETAHFGRTLLEEFDYGQVNLTGGPLKRQYDRVHAAYLALDNDRLLKVYRERAGLPAPGSEMGGWYDADGFVPGHSLGQYISGLARIGCTTGDSACQAKVGELVEGFATTMGSKDQIFAGPNAEKTWPCYILDKHLAGFMDAYRLSGVEQARSLLPRVYRAALPYLPERGRDRVGKTNPPYDESYVLPESLFSAYAMTGERVFYERAVAYLLDRDYFDPLARSEDVLPGRHAYSHVIALSSAGKAHLTLGDEKYLRAIKNASDFLVATQQYASGGWGPNETFIEPHKGQLYESLRTTEDHFETPCGSYAAIKLARYLLCAFADGRYGDNLERVLYNGILAVKEPDRDGDYPYYSTYGESAHKSYYPHKWPCCSGTLVQGVADYVKNIYFRAQDGVVVNLYAPSTLHWTRHGAVITLTQQTEYPLAGTVTFGIDCPAQTTFVLRMRIPDWIDGAATIHINGKLVSVQTVRGFASLMRPWNRGDIVTLELPHAFRTEAIDDLHPDTVAVLRGPLLYVELKPASGQGTLDQVDARKPVETTPGVFVTHGAGPATLHAPLYLVRDESYTTYFERI